MARMGGDYNIVTRLCKELSTYLVTFYAVVISCRVLSAVCAATIARPLPEREYIPHTKEANR